MDGDYSLNYKNDLYKICFHLMICFVVFNICFVYLGHVMHLLFYVCAWLSLWCMLNLDISNFENSVDSDQLAS